MKPTKKQDAKSLEFSKQLKKHFSHEELSSIILSLLGFSDIAHRFIHEKVSKLMELPIDVKYSLVQHVSFYRLMSSVARNELEDDFSVTGYMPMNEKAWKDDDDFEERFVFIVKKFYDGLKAEGKV